MYVISDAFVLKLAKLNELDREGLISRNRENINFSTLSAKLRDMIVAKQASDEHSLAEKLLTIREDISLYEAAQRNPRAVMDPGLISMQV